MAQDLPGAFVCNQYDNPDNTLAHYASTGPKIWNDTAGRVTHFVCGMGTCGTLSGTGRYLKDQNAMVRVIGVDPQGSLLHDLFHCGGAVPPPVYKLEGIGEDFTPKALDWSVIDDVIQVSDKDSLVAALLQRWARTTRWWWWRCPTAAAKPWASSTTTTGCGSMPTWRPRHRFESAAALAQGVFHQPGKANSH